MPADRSMKSPFTSEQEQRLSDFTAGLYDLSIWSALGQLGGNSEPEGVIFPDLADAYLKSTKGEGGLTSVECIYLAGERILKGEDE